MECGFFSVYTPVLLFGIISHLTVLCLMAPKGPVSPICSGNGLTKQISALSKRYGEFTDHLLSLFFYWMDVNILDLICCITEEGICKSSKVEWVSECLKNKLMNSKINRFLFDQGFFSAFLRIGQSLAGFWKKPADWELKTWFLDCTLPQVTL